MKKSTDIAVFSVFALLLSQALPAASFTTFEDKAAFLAATGGVNATGPLPNLGGVANSLNPAGNATVGSITFSLAPGGDNFSIGSAPDPDIYPQTPGNDIALGYENLEVQTAGPVYALGFEMVEPSEATMPPGAGSAVPSTYQITLFNGGAQVGQLSFTLPRPDVVSFVGIQSDTAFDRAWIIDVTDSQFIDDDEFFGEFYTGAAAAPSATLLQRAGTGTAVPGGSATFTAFPLEPAATAGRIVFPGLDSVGQLGHYTCLAGVPCRILANTATAIPSGTGNFTGFSATAVSGNVTTFIGAGAGQSGIYRCDSTIPTDSYRVLATLATAIPGGTGAFTNFSTAVLSSDRLGFIGAGLNQQGVYLATLDQAGTPGDPLKVADLATPIPQGVGRFTGFEALSASTGHLAILGVGESGQKGIYLASILSKLIAVGDTLGGKTVADLRLGRFALDGNTLSFAARFTDGSEGIYAADVALLRFAFEGFYAPVVNAPTVNRVQAGQAIPVKFSLGGDQGLEIFAAGFPTVTPLACGTSARLDQIEPTVTAGASRLEYDPATDRYTYVWKTQKAWANTCRQLALKFKDNSIYRADFRFRR